MKNHSDSKYENSGLSKDVSVDTVKLKLRCPSCAKLYEVESVDIETVSPQFQCMSCDCRFTFAYPPMNPANIVCSIVDALGHLTFQEDQKSCPKCAAISPAGALECYSCRVIFSRLEGLPEDPTLRAQPSLVRKWKLLMDDFTNEVKHEEFLLSCHQAEALNFAFNKYSEMKQALGGDDLCERMLNRLKKLSEVSVQSAIQSEAVTVPKANGSSRLQETLQILKSYFVPSIYILCAVLILWGSVSISNRNLVGVGVAIACLLTGVILSGKGHRAIR